MRGLGVGYEYLPEPGPVPVRFTDPHTDEDYEVECELIGYSDVGAGWAGGIRAVVRVPNCTWLKTVQIRRLMVPAVQEALRPKGGTK